MDNNHIKTLLENKVGFISKFLNPVYLAEHLEKAFSKGYRIGKDEYQKIIDTLTNEVASLKKSNTSLDLQLKSKKSLNTDLSNQLNRCNATNAELAITNKDLTKKNTLLTNNNKSLNAKIKDSVKAGDIKVLEQKLKEQETKFVIDKSKALKECTDNFMKTINKQDKEIARLQKLVSKNTKPVSKPITSTSHKTVDGKVNGKPAFTCPQVKEIKLKASKGMSHSELGTIYKVDRTTIDRIVAGKTYKKCK